MAKSKIHVCFEDHDLIAVNKPTGWISVPGRNNEEDPCVLVHLRNMFDEVLPVHRLDKGTSGILLFARHALAHQKLNDAFQNREVEKIYLALLHGTLKQEQKVESYLSHGARGTMKISKKGKWALSHFNPISSFGSFTLCEVNIETGRTHQIRVHAKHIGHPLVGDEQYGGHPISIDDIKPGKIHKKATQPLISRPALHAWKLNFTHPILNEEMSISAEPPKDMSVTLKQLEKWRSPKVG